jgi:cyanate lyase
MTGRHEVVVVAQRLQNGRLSFSHRVMHPMSGPDDRSIFPGGLDELVQVYGTTWKALIQEEFGDGIISAIDFDMTIERQPDSKGDRVKMTMSGKFLGYKEY